MRSMYQNRPSKLHYGVQIHKYPNFSVLCTRTNWSTIWWYFASIPLLMFFYDFIRIEGFQNLFQNCNLCRSQTTQVLVIFFSNGGKIACEILYFLVLPNSIFSSRPSESSSSAFFLSQPLPKISPISPFVLIFDLLNYYFDHSKQI